MSLENFVFKTLKLLEKERETEIEETRVLTEKLPAKELQRRGVCLLKLKIASRRTGLYGRVVISLEASQGDLPSHNITPGDIVGLNYSHGDSQAELLASGIVTRVSQSAVSVAFDESQELFSLDDETLALTELNKYHSGTAGRLSAVLFGEQELSPPGQEVAVNFFNSKLDDSQREAVTFALCQRELAVVHGPPGTGKTTTVIEIILQAIKQKLKVLACASSNIAVDNLVERLAVNKQKIVRIGHPARVLPHIQKYSLDAILSTSDETRLVEDVRKDLDKTLSKMRKARDKGEKQKFREEMKYLRKELSEREQTATRDILKRADVVLVTLTSATDDGPIRLLDEQHFDVVIIDECSQALEAACWIALPRASKCVLAGDHLQLPPTILSKDAAKEGLEKTLMERVLDLHGDKVMKMLTTQYRMHELIMKWSSEKLYNSKLQAHESVKSHLLRDLEGVEDCDETSEPLLFIDTAGCDLYELDLPEEISKGNEGEADIVAAHAEKLISCGVRQEDMAIIAPYNLQVELLRIRLSPQYPKLEIKSVDGFQGREKEVVIMSLVRSNPKGEVGFLAENRRINVAVTRARRHLTLVGDSETVSHDSFLKSLVDHMTACGEVQTAQEYINAGQVNQSKTPRPEHLNDLMSIKPVRKSEPVHGARPKVKTDKKPTRPKQDQYKSRQLEGRTARPVNEEKQAEIDARVQEFQTVLEDFICDLSKDVLEFPPSLSSHDRFLIHEVAEKLGLLHVSKGEDEDRHIVITKPDAKKNNQSESLSLDMTSQSDVVTDVQTKEVLPQLAKNGGVCTSKAESDTKVNLTDVPEKGEGDLMIGNDLKEEEMELPKKPSDKLTCQYCGKDVIRANFQLHETHCARKAKGAEEKSKEAKSQPDIKQIIKQRQISKKVESKLKKVANEDFDDLIETVQQIDGSCGFKKCKKSTATLGQNCEFCMGRFCLTHHMPEIHGCGDAAKAQARARISKEGVLYRGSGVPDRRPDAEKRENLEKKMAHKLNEMASKRKIKPKKNK